MPDYNSLKVPELKKLLQERSLAISGNKPDLIARLEESDTAAPDPKDATAQEQSSVAAPAPQQPSEPRAAALAAGGTGQVDTPIAVPNQVADSDPSKAQDLSVKEPAPASADATATTTTATDAPTTTAAQEKPAEDFSAGLAQTEVEQEMERRRKRAAKFGITVDDSEAEKALARAKRFGTGGDTAQSSLASSLDQALPERTARKRGRGHEGQDGSSKRGRSERGGGRKDGKEGKSAYKSVLDDPLEKQKADARAKKFGLST